MGYRTVRSDMKPEELRKILGQLEWTQQEAARRSGISRTQMNRYANGADSIPAVLSAYLRCASKEGE